MAISFAIDHNARSSKRLPRAARIGFTLVELLVVIAIIAILASLLFPAFWTAKERANMARCHSNLRQLSLAMGMYAADNGRYPYHLQVRGNPTNFWYWDRELKFYTHSDWTNDLFKCPSYKYRTRPGYYDRIGGDGWVNPDGSYGYNPLGTGELPRPSGVVPAHLGLGGYYLGLGADEGTRKESAVLVPREMVELGDGGGGKAVPPTASAPGASWFRHKKLTNVAFCDGHVETIPGDRHTAATESSRRRFNFDHEPHPETWKDRP